MNYITHLTGFFDRIVEDNNLNPTHISLYIALFQFWNVNRFHNPISITRNEVMRISKISSRATYHKCMRDLNDKEYIKYEPSYNPYKGSMVILFNFSDDQDPVQNTVRSTEKLTSKNEQVLNNFCTSSETSTDTSTDTSTNTSTDTSTDTSSEQALVSSINNINNTNIINNTNLENVLNLKEQAKNFQNENLVFKEKKKKEKKSAAKKKEKNPVTSSTTSRTNHPERILEETNKKPNIEEIKSYFLQENFPEIEANKFFNYFSSIGWLVGGKSPMVDWKAAAQNWMLNSIKYNPTESPPDRAKHLNVGNDKDYSEPL